MTVRLTLETVGRRVYVVGNSYAVKDKLKAAGCKWDADRQQWWIGAQKRSKIEALVEGGIEAPRGVEEDRLYRDRENILGRAQYKGRTYYYVWSGMTRRGTAAYRLMFRDGSKTFWADADKVEVIKEYRRPMTLLEIQSFAEEVKRHGGEYDAAAEARAVKQDRCRGCGRPIVDAPHHPAMGGYCGACAFDEYDM